MRALAEHPLEMDGRAALPLRMDTSGALVAWEDEDLIAREDMVITVTHAGYVKRTALATYRTVAAESQGELVATVRVARPLSAADQRTLTVLQADVDQPTRHYSAAFISLEGSAPTRPLSPGAALASRKS